MEIHKITIENKKPRSVLTGANTQLLLDGKLLKGVKSVNLNIGARDVAVITIEMYADVELTDAMIGQLEITKKEN